MGRSAATGVVDEWGRVFDASSASGTGVTAGLYVTDAAIIPTALGVNPSGRFLPSRCAVRMRSGRISRLSENCPRVTPNYEQLGGEPSHLPRLLSFVFVFLGVALLQPPRR